MDTSVHHEISRRYKPYSILIAVEELSLAPKGYLTSVIKPMGVNEVNYVKHTQQIRSKKKHIKIQLLIYRCCLLYLERKQLFTVNIKHQNLLIKTK